MAFHRTSGGRNFTCQVPYCGLLFGGTLWQILAINPWSDWLYQSHYLHWWCPVFICPQKAWRQRRESEDYDSFTLCNYLYKPSTWLPTLALQPSSQPALSLNTLSLFMSWWTWTMFSLLQIMKDSWFLISPVNQFDHLLLLFWLGFSSRFLRVATE